MTARLVVLALALAATMSALATARTDAPLPPREPLATLPSSLDAWHAVQDQDLDAETIAVLRADDYVSRTYVTGASVVNLFVAYYASQAEGDTIHSPMNCLPGTGWQLLSRARVTLDAGPSRQIDANTTVVQKGLQKHLVYYWYHSPGRTVASEYRAKAYLVLDSLRLGRSDAALVRVISPLVRGEADADLRARQFIARLYLNLDRHLPL